MTKPVYIIAEVGVNHNGSLERALQMVDVAAECGVDAVKFQTFRAEKLVTRDAVKAAYQQRQTGEGGGQYEMLKSLELSAEDFGVLKARCDARKVEFLSTPFDEVAFDVLRALGQSAWKVASGELTNLPYLRKIGALGQPVIMSTGMCELEEIAEALDALVAAGAPRDSITLLHCNTEYPTPWQDVNLRAMAQMRERFPGLAGVGYSDHTPGIEVPIAATALGATMIEKHFTLDRGLPGPDHAASLEPQELAAMVRAIKNVEQSLGDGQKRVTSSEAGNRAVARKSIVAAAFIAKGEVLGDHNLSVKRPGTGISPMRWDQVVGTRAKRDFREDEPIET